MIGPYFLLHHLTLAFALPLPVPCRHRTSWARLRTRRPKRTRKIRYLIYVPDFDAADRFAASIGNIASDGRPILGLDSRLLETALQSAPDSYVPAHIWTPWFAALGSQSGFDCIHLNKSMT
jgi:DNA helicase II / ATP-dependent DNA helicase PcrA